MKKLLLVSLLGLFLVSTQADARGGASSGGHAGGGGHSSFSSGSRGGFSSGGSYSRPSGSYASTSRPSSRVTTTTTTTRSYRSNYVSPGGYYGGMGMGYGYSNGLLTGLIIADLMHPQGTTVYTGGGYNGNALLYPDGRVVNQQGYQVGTYNNGQFNPVDGGFVAQQVPADAGVQAPAQPVVIQQQGLDGGDVLAIVLLTLLCSWFLFMALSI